MAVRGVAGLVTGAVLLFGAGIAVGAYVVGDAGAPPCWQVDRDLEGAQATLSETFGGGAEGQAALDEIAATVKDNPDCFSPAERASIARMAEIEPSTGGTDEAVPGVASESVSEP